MTWPRLTDRDLARTDGGGPSPTPRAGGGRSSGNGSGFEAGSGCDAGGGFEAGSGFGAGGVRAGAAA
ncbi:hypothetical protein I6A84_34515 [Frankia sp. CNm7]|uniref:Uncharacterized protein n=1 Tax=Frankia nepalensis TaxID=1836974 RepID=A0A937RJ68_9ACTN|nr:hypothetical protein [Frankia nepalensis]MBL7498672.1 hypothetical protein [Frankia nepalensis]MBL7509162.1 hypothetical protein [Frankia nepalensis]MBL7523061.1 hypothetical protein [Frankia nepalensis]MBL7633243.1 hypothetical protein [Frankia nepalensis]